VTELQKTLLFYAVVYFAIKGFLYLILYEALIIAEKYARRRYEKFVLYQRKKRAEEQINWKVAYSLYKKKHDIQEKKPIELSQLYANPKSFSAHSYVKPPG
jgi:hypothetical protein